MRRLIVAVIFALNLLNAQPVQAEEQLEDYDFEAVQEYLEENEATEELRFRDVVEDLIKGNTETLYKYIGELVYENFLKEMDSNREIIKRIIVVSLLAAVFSQFLSVFKESQISQNSFYVTFMLVVALCFQCFNECVVIAKTVIESVLGFMEVLLPLLLFSITMSSGTATGLGFYQIILIIITIINVVIIRLIIPAIVIYVIIGFVNLSLNDKRLNNITRLIKCLVDWGIKAMYCGVIGINIIKNMLLPYIDSLKGNAILKAVEAVPGVGDGVSGAASMLIGTATLIKNAVGVGIVLVFIVICITPVVKLGVIMLMQKLAGVIIEPVCDKRITEIVDIVAEGVGMLLKTVFTSVMLFLISIAIACISTNINYYAGS